MARFMEKALRHERRVMIAALACVVLIAGSYTVAGVGMEMSAISMTFGDMGGIGSMEMGSNKETPIADNWNGSKYIAMFSMWWLMMIAMMLPSAAPAVLLYNSVTKNHSIGDSTFGPAAVFTGGYLIVWAGFSAAATGAHMVLETYGFVSPKMMTLVAGPAGTAVIVATGLYQFTAFKDRCLSHCRAPAEFIAQHHRPGTLGALRLGVLHGAFCVGCCVGLMALLFVGGVMNLFWILALAALVGIEKLGPSGKGFARFAGGFLIAFGIFNLYTM